MNASPGIRAALRGFDPTEEQWRAISHPLEPAYLVAGAGSGKTAIMAARIAWAIETHGFAPSQILGLTFTNKAAEELESRVRLALEAMDHPSYLAGQITVQTYHAFSSSIVREHGLLVDVDPDSGLLSEAQQWQLVLSCIDRLPALDAIELRSAGALVRATLSLASAISDHMVSVKDVRSAAERVLSAAQEDDKILAAAAKRAELCDAVEEYTRAKRASRRIDFGDQVTKAVSILESRPEVRSDYRTRFPVVLLDEYQDTNVAQKRLMKALIPEGGAVTAVGDARQAIYAFRGATMYNLIGFAQDFPRSGGKSYDEISLSQNFRSGRRILEVANRIVGRIEESRRPGAPLTPQGSNGEGEVLIGLFGDERSEARWIAQRCLELHGAPTLEGRDPVRWRDMAILVRRKSRMDAIMEVLEEHEIPVEVVGLGGLLKTPEVTEVVAWLRALETRPGSNRWLARLLLGPRWRIHYRDLALCSRWAADRNDHLKMTITGGDRERAMDLEPGDVGFALAEALDHLDEIEGLGDEARRRLQDFRVRLEGLRTKVTGALLDLVQEVIATTGIADSLSASPSRSAAAARQNLSNFLDYMASFAPVEGEATLRSLIEYLDAAEQAEETLEATQPADSDSVKLMTVHSAKGLEFECVFVPSVAAGRKKDGGYRWSVFPSEGASNPLTSYTELPFEVRDDARFLPRWTGSLKEFKEALDERSLEDERRLFYVALTRAKQRLHVSAAWWYGRDRNPRGTSLFFDEVRALEEEGLVGVVSDAEQPPDNPQLELLEERREWPPMPRIGMDDPLFPEGWGAAAEHALDAGGIDDLLTRLSPEDVERSSKLRETHLQRLDDLVLTPLDDDVDSETAVVSATTYVKLKGAKVTLAELQREVPTRPSVKRYLGTEIHRLIEERYLDALDDEESAQWPPFPDESELDEPDLTEKDMVAQSLAHWTALGYGDRRVARLPSGLPMVELPFSLKRDGMIVKGRIDAVFESDDGGIEIVDWKSGRRYETEGEDQLELYASALHANGLIPDGAPVRLTYAFLDGAPPNTREWKPI